MTMAEVHDKMLDRFWLPVVGWGLAIAMLIGVACLCLLCVPIFCINGLCVALDAIFVGRKA